MKRCPTCQRIYTDDTLSYCLEDGAHLLAGATGTDTGETLVLNDSDARHDPPPTEILPPSLAPTIGAQQKLPTPTVRQQARATQQDQPEAHVAASVPQRKSTTSVVALTVVATILLLGLGGLGTWLLLRDGTPDVGDVSRKDEDSNGGQGADNTTIPPGGTNNQPPGNTNTTPTPRQTPTPSPTPSATPQPTQGTDTNVARQEVMNALTRWTQTMRSANVDAHMANYADTLHTYYLQKNYSASRVRANVARAFSKYNSFDVRLTNMTIEVDPSGQRAVATFDKTFTFTGATTYSGSGLNRFWLEKIGGRWLITGEKDLKTYY
jgi:hypothetical protein